MYHPPKPAYQAQGLIDHIESTIASVLAGGLNVVILIAGDFNKLADSALTALGLLSLVNKPTHMGHLLDRIYCTQNIYPNIKIVSSLISTKHSMVIARPDNCFIKDYNKKRRLVTIRRRSAAQDAKACNLLRSADWSLIFSNYDCQSAFDQFYSIINCIFDNVYPPRRVTITSRDSPFITPNIKFLLRRRNRLMGRGRVEEANAISTRVGAAIKIFNSRRLADINFTQRGVGGDAVSAMWSRVREVSGGGVFGSPDPPPGITADTLNSHYSSVSHDASYAPPSALSSCAPCPASSDWPSPLSVYKLLTQSKTNAIGCDGIPPWFSRFAAPFLAQPLAYLYCLSVRQSVVPSQWKCAIIKPIPKVPSPARPVDYRPISVLPLYSTLIEKLVIRHFIYPLLRTQPLTDALADQFAFRPTGSTTAAITNLLHHTTSLLSSEPYVHLISLGFSKAFDVARHSTLFERLRQLPLSDNVYFWLLTFL